MGPLSVLPIPWFPQNSPQNKTWYFPSSQSRIISLIFVRHRLYKMQLSTQVQFSFSRSHVILSVSSFLKLTLASKINYSMEGAPRSLPDKATARHLGRILVMSRSWTFALFPNHLYLGHLQLKNPLESTAALFLTSCHNSQNPSFPFFVHPRSQAFQDAVENSTWRASIYWAISL